MRCQLIKDKPPLAGSHDPPGGTGQDVSVLTSTEIGNCEYATWTGCYDNYYGIWHLYQGNTHFSHLVSSVNSLTLSTNFFTRFARLPDEEVWSPGEQCQVTHQISIATTNLAVCKVVTWLLPINEHQHCITTTMYGIAIVLLWLPAGGWTEWEL